LEFLEMSMNTELVNKLIPLMQANPTMANAELAGLLQIDLSDSKVKASFAVACGRAKKAIKEGTVSTEGTLASPAATTAPATAGNTTTTAPATTTAAPATPRAAKRAPVPAGTTPAGSPATAGFRDDLLDKTAGFLSLFDDPADATRYIQRVSKLQVKK
jgi:septal ring-binding cell division protein DamX